MLSRMLSPTGMANGLCGIALNLIATQCGDGRNRVTILQRDVKLWQKLEANRIAGGNVTTAPVRAAAAGRHTRSGRKVTATSQAQSFITKPEPVVGEDGGGFLEGELDSGPPL